VILSQAEHSGSPGEEVDFLELHTVAKSVIYMNEGADAILHAIEDMLETCTSSTFLQNPSNSNPPHSTTWLAPRSLRYSKGQFQSTKLRLKSLEKRMDNIIHLVRSQSDKLFHCGNKTNGLMQYQ